MSSKLDSRRWSRLNSVVKTTGEGHGDRPVPGHREDEQQLLEVGPMVLVVAPGDRHPGAEPPGPLPGRIGRGAVEGDGGGTIVQFVEVWSAPHFLVHPKWESIKRIKGLSCQTSICCFVCSFLSQAALYSFGVAYPRELCGRTVLYSRRNHDAFARASFTVSNSTRSKNSSRNRL